MSSRAHVDRHPIVPHRVPSFYDYLMDRLFISRVSSQLTRQKGCCILLKVDFNSNYYDLKNENEKLIFKGA